MWRALVVRLHFRQNLLCLAAQIWWYGAGQTLRTQSFREKNQRLKKIVADLELDKLILKENLDYLKPKA